MLSNFLYLYSYSISFYVLFRFLVKLYTFTMNLCTKIVLNFFKGVNIFLLFPQIVIYSKYFYQT